MARITNFGRKRTYVETGFATVDAAEQQVDTGGGDSPNPDSESEKRLKKSRKRRKKEDAASGKERTDAESVQVNVEQNDTTSTKTVKTGEKPKREEMRHARAAASERRRLKRANDRQAFTTCLACRKKGHAVKDCPDARVPLHGDEPDAAGAPGKSAVGVCYRCGSKKHNLSRCKRPGDAANPLPYASCFVCSERGHLASSCPQNEGRGIYPNGGSCKLCGETSHLAKDCQLRRNEVASQRVMLGNTGTEGGPDEDDFHVLKRRRDTLQKEEAAAQRIAGKSLAQTVKLKPKVVTFK